MFVSRAEYTNEVLRFVKFRSKKFLRQFPKHLHGGKSYAKKNIIKNSPEKSPRAHLSRYLEGLVTSSKYYV